MTRGGLRRLRRALLAAAVPSRSRLSVFDDRLSPRQRQQTDVQRMVLFTASINQDPPPFLPVQKKRKEKKKYNLDENENRRFPNV